MSPRRIADLSVHPIGLGAMPLSDPAMLAERPARWRPCMPPWTAA